MPKNEQKTQKTWHNTLLKKTQWPHIFSYFMYKIYWKIIDIFSWQLNIGEESTLKEEFYELKILYRGNTGFGVGNLVCSKKSQVFSFHIYLLAHWLSPSGATKFNK